MRIRYYLFFFIASLLLAFPAFSQDMQMSEAEVKEGEKLFLNNCASCHNKNMKDDMTGPALGGVQERWEDQPEVLYEWIKNSQAVVQSGNDYAVNLYNEWNQAVMQSFPALDNGQIDKILAYVDAKYRAVGIYAPKEVAGGPVVGGPVEPKNNTPLYIGLFVVLAILALILARIIANLNQIATAQETGAVPEKKSLTDILTSRGVIGFVIFALVVLGGYTTVNNAIALNRQQGYQPEQPIKFSHKTHSGIQKIDCQYCHDGARRSKHSVIPPTSTCMNCHAAVKVGSQYGTQELTKIYASAGWDPNENKYVEVEKMSEEEISAIYKKWIADNYIKDNDLVSLDAEGTLEVDEQWENIVASLTTDVKKEVYGSIPWVRIHNLPDHAYFNHAQHVSVGKVECQTCHGPIEEMEVVQQYSPLSMGWCINCHRQTEVNFSDNNYYESYHLYKEEIKEGERQKVTVEEIGGLECQKCHY